MHHGRTMLEKSCIFVTVFGFTKRETFYNFFPQKFPKKENF